MKKRKLPLSMGLCVRYRLPEELKHWRIVTVAEGDSPSGTWSGSTAWAGSAPTVSAKSGKPTSIENSYYDPLSTVISKG